MIVPLVNGDNNQHTFDENMRVGHYVEGIHNWDPIWPRHAIRIIPGPSAMWFDANGERLEALYVLALMAGLRRGELLALRWDDIDFGSRQLHVRRAMQRVNGKLQVAEPKTSSSRRTRLRGGWTSGRCGFRASYRR